MEVIIFLSHPLHYCFSGSTGTHETVLNQYNWCRREKSTQSADFYCNSLSLTGQESHYMQLGWVRLKIARTGADVQDNKGRKFFICSSDLLPVKKKYNIYLYQFLFCVLSFDFMYYSLHSFTNLYTVEHMKCH